MVRRGLGLAVCAFVVGCPGGGGKGAPEELACDGGVPEELVDDPDLDVDYRVDCRLPVPAGASLRVAPGVVVQFGAGGGIDVDGGTFEAVGTKEAPIVLEAADPAEGWVGVRVFGETPATFQHVVVRDAGLETPEGAASLLVGAPSYAEGVADIRDCVFEAGRSVGLSLYGELTAFSGNTITGHTVPVQVSDHSLDQLAPDNELTGNDLDVVEIVPQAIPPADEQVWPDIPVPWLATRSLSFAGEQTLKAGATLLLTEGANVYALAPIRLQGSADDPVVIDGLEQRSGEWGSLYVTTGLNELSFAELRNGSGLDDLFGQAGMLVVDGNAGGNVEIRDCVFEGGAAWGIWIGLPDSFNQDIESVNTFANNAAGAVHYP